MIEGGARDPLPRLNIFRWLVRMPVKWSPRCILATRLGQAWEGVPMKLGSRVSGRTPMSVPDSPAHTTCAFSSGCCNLGATNWGNECTYSSEPGALEEHRTLTAPCIQS